MRIEKLVLRNFRNIEDCTFWPDPRLNFLIGRNGQGKTSFLEALGFIATLRSFRGSKSAEVVQWDKPSAEIICLLKPDDPSLADWATELKISFLVTDRERGKATKIAHINGKPYRSSTQYLSQRFGAYELGFHAVVFNPSDHDLVRGDPSTRRTYLDRVLAAEDVDYLKIYQKYQRVLEQRNALLKSEIRPNRELLIGFTEPLAHYSAILAHKRLAWIERAIPRVNEIAAKIAPLQSPIRLTYLSNWVPPTAGLSINNSDLRSVHFTGQGHLPSLELLEQAFWNQLSVLEAAEWRAGHSLVGPHRDDWAFYLGDQLLKGHGSQGEVRSALLALKLSEIELFQSATGHRPLFLLDDFSSELDRERRSFLLSFLAESDLQVFVTTTEDLSLGGKVQHVVNGNLEKA